MYCNSNEFNFQTISSIDYALIQANLTLSTLSGFNLLVAIRANRKQLNYAVLTFCDFKPRVI